MTLTLIPALAASLWLQTAPAQAQTPAPAPAPQETAALESTSEEAPKGPLTWDELPEPLRARINERLGKPAPQAVLEVVDAVTPDAAWRTVDHGAVLATQTVRPAAFATLTVPTRNARKYGPAGAVLWAGVDEDGDWWCWRNGERFPNWAVPSDIYCYRDTDADGDFDVLKENASPETTLGQSRFQFTTLGRDERFEGEPAYTSGGGADFEEKIVLRYDGPGAGKIVDGRLTEGVVLFELLTGPAVPRTPTGNLLVAPAPGVRTDGLDPASTLIVRLDANGKGRFTDARGIVLDVDRVNVDGTASVRLTSLLPKGRALLFPPPSRQDLLEFIAGLMGREAAPETSGD